MPITLKVKTSSIEDGKHSGVITSVVSRDVSFQKQGKTEVATYIDVIIETQTAASGPIDLKWGAPANLNPKGKLGKMVSSFAELAPNSDIDVEKVLLGKRVSFMTMQNDAGFVDIVDGSIKPLA